MRSYKAQEWVFLTEREMMMMSSITEPIEWVRQITIQVEWNILVKLNHYINIYSLSQKKPFSEYHDCVQCLLKINQVVHYLMILEWCKQDNDEFLLGDVIVDNLHCVSYITIGWWTIWQQWKVIAQKSDALKEEKKKKIR